MTDRFREILSACSKLLSKELPEPIAADASLAEADLIRFSVLFEERKSSLLRSLSKLDQFYDEMLEVNMKVGGRASEQDEGDRLAFPREADKCAEAQALREAEAEEKAFLEAKEARSRLEAEEAEAEEKACREAEAKKAEEEADERDRLEAEIAEKARLEHELEIDALEAARESAEGHTDPSPQVDFLKAGNTVRALPHAGYLTDGTGRIPADTTYVFIERVDWSDGTVRGRFVDGGRAGQSSWLTASHLIPLRLGDDGILEAMKQASDLRSQKDAQEAAEARARYQQRTDDARRNCSNHNSCPKCSHLYCGGHHEGDTQAMSYFYMICKCSCTPWDGDSEGGRKSHGCCRCAASFLDSYCESHGRGHPRAN